MKMIACTYNSIATDKNEQVMLLYAQKAESRLVNQTKPGLLTKFVASPVRTKMTNRTLSAKVANVQIGNLMVEGLMDKDGRFYVAVPQAADLFLFDKRQASRNLKTLLGKDFPFDFHKLRTPLNSKAVNAIALENFERIVFELALKGNEGAINFSRSLLELALQQLFSDAFCVKFDKEDRADWMVDRFNGKTTRRIFTDAIKRHIDTRSISPDKAKWIYVDCSDKINVAVLGDRAKDIRQLRELAESDLLRDTHAASQSQLTDRIEDFAARMVDRATEPADATNQAITFYLN